MWAPFAQLLLEGSTAYWADYPWTQGGVTYEPRVIAWDRIERSIPAQSGLPQHSDARLRVADTDRAIRDLLGSYSFRRKTCKIYLALQGGPDILDTEPVFTGEIIYVRFGEAWVEFTLRDTLFAWIDEEFPALITTDVFPTFPITEPVFAPVLQGHLVAADGQGCVPLPYIGVLGSPPTADRWAIACHEVWDVIGVYRKEPGDGVYTLVDPIEYSIVQDSATVYNIPITFTFLDFLVPQPEGTLISIDVDGIDARGEWGALPAVGGDVLRNPIDYFINMTFFWLAKSGRSDIAEIFDTDAISFMRDRCEPGGDNPCYADHAILAPTTPRQWLGQFLTSFEMFMHQQQSTVGNPGTLTLGLLDDTGAGPHFSEVGNIDAGSFEEVVGDPSFNELIVHFSENYRTSVFEQQTLYENENEQDMLGGSDPDASPAVDLPKAERDTLEFPMVREVDTAARSVARRLNFLSSGSYRQTFTLPLPGLATVLEPGKSAFITHRMGFPTGGYDLREVKILRVSIDVGRLAAAVETILLEPIVSLVTGDIIRVFYDIAGTGDEQVYRAALTGAINGTNRVFTLPDTPISGTEEVFINGWPQFGLYALDGDELTMTYTPQVGDTLEVFYDVSGTGNEPRYRVTPTGSIDGVNSTFTLPETPALDSERVYVNNFMQVKDVDYTMGSPSAATISFLTAVPQTGDEVRVWYDVTGGSRPRRRFRIIPAGAVNNVNTRFTLNEDVITNSEQVFNNFAFQMQTTDYEYLDAAELAALGSSAPAGMEFTFPPQRN